MSDEDLSLISYRLSSVEEKQVSFFESLTKINEKLDKILEGQGKTSTAQAIETERRIQLELRVRESETQLKDLNTQVVGLKISLAERLGPGALAGGGVGLLIGIIQYMVVS